MLQFVLAFLLSFFMMVRHRPWLVLVYPAADEDMFLFRMEFSRWSKSFGRTNPGEARSWNPYKNPDPVGHGNGDCLPETAFELKPPFFFKKNE